jgi:hypothetical protein
MKFTNLYTQLTVLNSNFFACMPIHNARTTMERTITGRSWTGSNQGIS